MKLPTITTPTYELTVPSTGQKVSYRPYLTKEEKLLLMAKESGEEADMFKALKTLITNCVDDITNANDLTTFDFEYIFLKLRSVSSGEIVAPSITCDGVITDDEGNETPCKNSIRVAVDFSTIEPTRHDNHTNKFELTDDGIGVVMKYPTFSTIEKLASKNLPESGAMIETFVQCIDYIFDANSTYPASESTEEELTQFVESLTSAMRSKIQTEFFDSMPSVEHHEDIVCDKCGKVHTVRLKGIRDFF